MYRQQTGMQKDTSQYILPTLNIVSLLSFVLFYYIVFAVTFHKLFDGFVTQYQNQKSSSLVGI